MLGDDPWAWIKGLLKVIKQPLNGGTQFRQLLLRDLASHGAGVDVL